MKFEQLFIFSSSIDKYRQHLGLNVVDVSFRFTVLPSSISTSWIEGFEADYDNWMPELPEYFVTIMRGYIDATLKKASEENPGKRICRNDYNVEYDLSFLQSLIRKEIRGWYDFQILRAVFLKNIAPTHPGGYDRNEIHPNSVVAHVPMDIADVRCSCHPWGRGKYSQW